ncbi:MAG TPA: CoA-binding protein [Candidatus Atribacteria bacterium]|nr:CoA-binding protein [Candidatus Atribacteria bacterium]
MNKNLVEEFLRNKNIFAIVGVSRDKRKYGYKVYISIKKAGYKVYPINPNTNEILGDRCYHSIKDLPEKPDVVVTVVPPKITEQIVKQCKILKIDKIWMQPGSESEKSINFCKLNNIKVVHDICFIINGLKEELD